MTVTKNQRSTRQQTAMRELLDECREFRTAQQLHQLLSDQESPIGLATVYRTLSRMADSGEVDTIINSDGETQYRRCSGGHHHHLVCVKCGTTVEISADAVEAWAQSVAADNGFTQSHHTVEISGRCKSCS
ncbi:MAG: transcriptional repressor [Micrococcales bacterium]|nr:transcriptional repressor [Micrococcales bacterium]